MLEKVRARLRELLARLLRRAPPRPGHFVGGHKMSIHGLLHAAPWIWPSRKFLLYVPAGYGGWKRRPLVVLIHGCKQAPEEFAAATRIAALADEYGWLVLLPRQAKRANPWSCWNWFDPATAAGRGEAAIVAAQVRAVRRRFRVDRRRVVVAGLSAGGALAATLGVRHPELFAGVFVHSGLPCGAAANAMTAMQVMKRGPDTDSARIGAEARVAAGGAVRLPLYLVHGEGDAVVDAANAHALVRQYLALNGRAPDAAPADGMPPPDVEHDVLLHDGRSMKTAEYHDDRRVVVRLVRVPGLGHAWSGGNPEYPFNDPHDPDATGLLGEFVEGRRGS